MSYLQDAKLQASLTFTQIYNKKLQNCVTKLERERSLKFRKLLSWRSKMPFHISNRPPADQSQYVRVLYGPFNKHALFWELFILAQ